MQQVAVPGLPLTFNATPDHRIMRELQHDGFTDTSEATGSGLNATWPQVGLHPRIAGTIQQVHVVGCNIIEILSRLSCEISPRRLDEVGREYL